MIVYMHRSVRQNSESDSSHSREEENLTINPSIITQFQSTRDFFSRFHISNTLVTTVLVKRTLVHMLRNYRHYRTSTTYARMVRQLIGMLARLERIISQELEEDIYS